MTSVRTRRQTAGEGPAVPREDALTNGNGKGHEALSTLDAEARENIFLFYPNLIGVHAAAPAPDD